MPRRIHLNPSFWFTVAAYALCGASLFFAASIAARVFTHLDDSFPIPIRVVVNVGPFGWLALALLGALASLWVRSTVCRLVFTIIFSLLTFGVLYTVLNTSLDSPSRISASNERPGVDAGWTILFAVSHHRPRPLRPSVSPSRIAL